LFFDPLELLPPDRTFPTPAAQHLAPVTLHGSMDPLQCPNVAGNAVVRIVTAEHLIEMIHLLLKRQVPHPPHLVLQPHERASPRLFISTHNWSRLPIQAKQMNGQSAVLPVFV
jgi:hypothetical protein